MVGEEEGEALHRSPQRTENIQDLHEDSTSTQVPQCLLCLLTVHILSSLCFAELIFPACILNTQPSNKTLFYFSLCSHTVKRNIPLRSEVSQIPELPRGGDGELDRGVSSRRVNCSWWPIFNFMVPDLCTTYIKLYWIFLIVSLI